MRDETERKIAQEVRDIMATNIAQLYLWQSDPEELAICCEYHADMLPILEDHVRRYPPAQEPVNKIKAAISARAAARAAGAAIDEVIRLAS